MITRSRATAIGGAVVHGPEIRTRLPRRVLDDRARTLSLGTAQSADGICTFRHALPLAAADIDRLEMIDADQSVAYSADL